MAIHGRCKFIIFLRGQTPSLSAPTLILSLMEHFQGKAKNTVKHSIKSTFSISIQLNCNWLPGNPQLPPYIYIHLYIYTYMHYSYTYIYIFKYIRIYIYIYIHILCIYIYIYIYICIYTHIMCIYIYIFTNGYLDEFTVLNYAKKSSNPAGWCPQICSMGGRSQVEGPGGKKWWDSEAVWPEMMGTKIMGWLQNDGKMMEKTSWFFLVSQILGWVKFKKWIWLARSILNSEQKLKSSPSFPNGWIWHQQKLEFGVQCWNYPFKRTCTLW